MDILPISLSFVPKREMKPGENLTVTDKEGKIGFAEVTIACGESQLRFEAKLVSVVDTKSTEGRQKMVSTFQWI